MRSSKILEELQKDKDLYDYLSTNTGMTVQDPDDVQSIYSTLKAEVIRTLKQSTYHLTRLY